MEKVNAFVLKFNGVKILLCCKSFLIIRLGIRLGVITNVAFKKDLIAPDDIEQSHGRKGEKAIEYVFYCLKMLQWLQFMI